MRWSNPPPAPVVDTPPKVDLLSLSKIQDHPALAHMADEYRQLGRELLASQERITAIETERSSLQYRRQDEIAIAEGARSAIGNHSGGDHIPRSPKLAELDVEELELKRAIVDQRDQLARAEAALSAKRRRLQGEIEQALAAMAVPLLQEQEIILHGLLRNVEGLAPIGQAALRILGRHLLSLAACDIGGVKNRAKAISQTIASLTKP